MKNSFISLLIVAASLQVNYTNAAVQDTGRVKKFIHNFNLGIQWFEVGKSIALKQNRLETLNYGLDKYMANINGEISVGFLGVSVYFKDMIGIEAIFSHRSTKSNGEDFENYLSNKYPGYHLPVGIFRYSSENTGIGMRLCYRKHFKHFFIEPKLQFTINSFDNYFTSFRLKEIGTNQYIDYSMVDEIHGYKNSYHLILNIAKRFDPFKDIAKIEVGLMGEFMISPINQSITVTEAQYGQMAVTNTESFKLYNPIVSFSLSLKVFLEHREK